MPRYPYWVDYTQYGYYNEFTVLRTVTEIKIKFRLNIIIQIKNSTYY